MATAITASADSNVSEPRHRSRKPAKTSLHRAMNDFFDRDDAELKLGTRTDYDHTLLLLEEYINTFGSALLGAAEIAPRLSSPTDGPVSKCYNPASLVKFFRGFILFFLQYKVNAPKDTKETFVKIVEEFVAWLSEKGHLPNDFQTKFELFDMQTIYGAVHAANILGKAVAHSEKSRKHMEDIHDGEPLYMVSRVKSGKLWFIYYAGKLCAEFGPVNVPLGVSDVIKPGWLIECTFGRYNGRWQIKSVGDVLPV